MNRTSRPNPVMEALRQLEREQAKAERKKKPAPAVDEPAPKAKKGRARK